MLNTPRELLERIEFHENAAAAAKKELAGLLGFGVGTTGQTKPSAQRAGQKTSTPGARPSRRTAMKKPGIPVSEQVRLLLMKRPLSFAELALAIGDQHKKAIRSHLEKRRTAGIYAHDGERYSIAPVKVKKPKPEKAKAPTGSSGKGTQAEMSL